MMSHVKVEFFFSCFKEHGVINFKSKTYTKMKGSFIIAILILVATSCSEQKEDNRKKDVENANNEIENQVGSFTPAFIQSTPINIHYAVTVAYNNSTFTIVPNSFSQRTGKTFARGNYDLFPFKVNFFDKNGKILDRYSMEDPRIVRSCDAGDGASIKQIENGTFTLLLPSIKEISVIEFTPTQDQKSRIIINFSAQVDSLNIRRRSDSL